MSKQCTEFFSRPNGQQDELFKTYSLEDQLAIYKCGMNRVPADWYFAAYIADKGEVVIPVLVEKLDAERDEFSQYAIIRIFEMLALKGHMRNRTDLTEKIRGVVGRMRIGLYRKMPAQSLEKIENDIK